MSANELPSSAKAFQEQIRGGFVSRKLLLHNPFDHNTQQASMVAPSPLITHENNLSGNVLMLLSVLICGIICCLGLHYIIRCAFRHTSSFMISEPVSNLSTPHGSSNKGIKKKALKMFPVVSYSPEMNLPGLGEECVICLSDFVSGEKLRLLPKCNHGFHVRCIDKWLQQHLTCPSCRHCLVETCQKILGDSSQVIATPAVAPAESVIVRIAPLEPSSAQAFHEEVLGGFISRKLLLHNPFDHNTQRALAVSPTPPISHENNVSGTVLMLLSVLICGIIFCLWLHFIICLAFRRYSSFMISEPVSNLSTQRGSSNKGIKKKALRMFPVVSYSHEMNLSGIGEECVICLSDFVTGEKLRLLPKCNHGFHVRCIDKWLQQHLTCPNCRHCLVETCQKILGESTQVMATPAAAPTEIVTVRIAPLEPSSAQAFHEQVLGGFISRKLLLHNPFDHNTQRALAVAPTPSITHENSVSGNVLMLLSVLICGIIFCVGFHYIICLAFRRYSSFMISEPVSSLSTQRGSSNKGIKKKALRMFPVVSYSHEMNLSGIGEECVICLSDFVSGEKLRLLPKCNHGFHVRCIDKWLQQHLTCPKCRHSLVDTCQKILGEFSQADQVTAAPTDSVSIRIAPLEPESE